MTLVNKSIKLKPCTKKNAKILILEQCKIRIGSRCELFPSLLFEDSTLFLNFTCKNNQK